MTDKERLEQLRLASRGLQERLKDSREAHKAGGARAGIRAYCRGNKWLEENAKAVGNL